MVQHLILVIMLCIQCPNFNRMKLLYPFVNSDETPFPLCWSAHEKCVSIDLSQNNMCAHFKGKEHNDAAAVRADNPIPTACGIYYFEVGTSKLLAIMVTMAIYILHLDLESYGPTFTEGDIIGCGINFINNCCFFTKNGQHLGIAVIDYRTWFILRLASCLAAERWR
ncbi:hypothetical protein EVAR_72057_1 [Eumeta japonica]|uniref:SPRY domain-containing protein n=1 Tax=Eumeta variegata TaxID=151549 RepID=A0A4C1SE22_EUMVA|nr:hypothetical protein EVAR_72057_1 [Eumeta japonica]